LSTLGKTGDFKDGVLKVNIPRGDLSVTIAKRPAPTPFGFGGWVAFAKGDPRSWPSASGQRSLSLEKARCQHAESSDDQRRYCSRTADRRTSSQKRSCL
jgi:hypothetical protein